MLQCDKILPAVFNPLWPAIIPSKSDGITQYKPRLLAFHPYYVPHLSMSLSLREQLLAAGLVTQKQARQSERQQRQERKRDSQEPTARPSAAAQAQAAKAVRDQELNRQREEKAARKARRAEIRQLVEQHRIPRIESDDYFNFVDRGKIHYFAVNPQIREKLTRGELAIARHNGFYALVPQAIADRIRERDAAMLVPLEPTHESSPTEDDPYKDFVVPDDLKW